MGSSYYGPNSDCYHCQGCGTHRPCDDCTANCCQTNMNEHRSLRSLENSFIDKVYSAKKYIYNECNSAVSYLAVNYGIRIIIYNDNNKNYLEQSKDIIESMRSKKEQIKREASNIKVDRFKYREIQKIKNAHREKMEEIENHFSEKMEEIERKNNSDIEIQEAEIKKKEEIKCKLNNEKNEIENKYKNNYETFKNENENRLIKSFNRKKNEIDLEYSYLDNMIEPDFEYSEEEKSAKKYMLENINEIRKYSRIIPNYQNVIKAFKISNYLS